MKLNVKILASTLLKPAAWLAEKLQHLTRLWAFTRLAVKLKQPIDNSIVVLDCPEISGTAHIKLGKNLYLWRDLYWETQDAGSIEIADNVVMSRGVHIVAFDRVSIGKNTMIGEYSSIRDANHRIHTELPIRYAGHDSAPIEIGENVWIGRGVTILSGITIGDNAVIGANAVVTKDVPANSIAVGIPAEVIRTL
ncbi:acyltransferase [Candidatus Albibeggiatoa sp. nov. NOAA]|uniref:acyltransferase n=1 Tax=Candidatus Albibeggiatoa sp. nov. NOAA TaxID=3162724 RepID=UPI0032FE43AC|nr:acyltransferase [Thiotrichaceae bacterium]